MKYFITQYGNIIDENNQLIPQEENNPLYQQYLEYLSNNGEVYPTAFVTAGELSAIEDAQDLAEHLLLEEKGAELIYRTKKRLIRRFKKALITKPQAKKVREILNPIFQFLKTGDLDIANDKAILLPIETNANVQGELTWFKEKLTEIQ